MLASRVRRKREVACALMSPSISTAQGTMDVVQCTNHDQLVLPLSVCSLSQFFFSTISDFLSLYLSKTHLFLSPQSQTHGQPQTPAREALFATRTGRGEPRDTEIKRASFIHCETSLLPVNEGRDRAVRRLRRSAILRPAHR